jgi:hypothetical protein
MFGMVNFFGPTLGRHSRDAVLRVRPRPSLALSRGNCAPLEGVRAIRSGLAGEPHHADRRHRSPSPSVRSPFERGAAEGCAEVERR